MRLRMLLKYLMYLAWAAFLRVSTLANWSAVISTSCWDSAGISGVPPTPAGWAPGWFGFCGPFPPPAACCKGSWLPPIGGTWFCSLGTSGGGPSSPPPPGVSTVGPSLWSPPPASAGVSTVGCSVPFPAWHMRCSNVSCAAVVHRWSCSVASRTSSLRLLLEWLRRVLCVSGDLNSGHFPWGVVGGGLASQS